MADELIRAISGDGFIRITSVNTRDTVQRAKEIHGMLPVATAALGRTLSAAVMIGSDLKDERGSVTINIRGGGPLGAVVAVADCEGNVRGYVQNPETDIPRKYEGKLDVGSAVGADGRLTLIKDLNLKEPYIGSVKLVSGEIAEDIAQYYAVSEQVGAACALGVLLDGEGNVLASGGYLIQLLPGTPEETILELEESIAKNGAVTGMLAEGLTAWGIIERVLEGFSPRELDRMGAEYRCTCSREKVTGVLASLGRAELEDIVRAGNQTEVGCQFCDEKYAFSVPEVQAILDSGNDEEY